MRIFSRHNAALSDLERRVERLESVMYRQQEGLESLQRETVYIEGESPDEKGFKMFDQRPRIGLKTIVLALAEHLGMRIEVESAKPPSAKLTRKLD